MFAPRFVRPWGHACSFDHGRSGGMGSCSSDHGRSGVMGVMFLRSWSLWAYFLFSQRRTHYKYYQSSSPCGSWLASGSFLEIGKMRRWIFRARPLRLWLLLVRGRLLHRRWWLWLWLHLRRRLHCRRWRWLLELRSVLLRSRRWLWLLPVSRLRLIIDNDRPVAFACGRRSPGFWWW